MKLCSKCKVEKNVVEFAKKKNGLNAYCRVCQREYWQIYYANPDRKEKHIAATRTNTSKRREKLKEVTDKLKSVPCADCKGHYRPWQMDFDHLDGQTKEDNVARLVHEGAPLKKVLQEIEKCEVVCANCHRDRTHQRARSSIG